MTFDIYVSVRGTRCDAALGDRDSPISTGCRGEFRVILYADESWAAMDKTVVFRAGRVSRSQHIGTDGTSCLVPPEVLAERATYLEIGLHGTSSEDVVRTTNWANLHGIMPGAIPTDDPTETPDLYAQLLAEIRESKALAASAAESTAGAQQAAAESQQAAEVAQSSAKTAEQAAADAGKSAADALQEAASTRALVEAANQAAAEAGQSAASAEKSAAEAADDAADAKAEAAGARAAAEAGYYLEDRDNSKNYRYNLCIVGGYPCMKITEEVT